ncbi:hypothetical protein J4P90_09430 [Bacillus sp. SY8(2021)]|uniref:Uncharacterized protein n=1 Tax=Bacillus arachidis TaxID=2819290 RepID=A0ABS3NX28_9BACI|nr:hypothetical protein [Bacillus arachidis]
MLRILSRYLWAVILPPQNSAKTNKLGGDEEKHSLIKVSLYEKGFFKVMIYGNIMVQNEADLWLKSQSLCLLVYFR